MKILGVGDPHVTGVKPKSRTDNYTLTLLSKFREIGELIPQFKAQAVVIAGDLFHTPDVSPQVVAMFARVMLNWKVPIYIVPGNHDLYGMNVVTLPRTMLGLLSSIGVVHLLNEETPCLVESGKDRLWITGAPYRYDIDRSTGREAYNVKRVGEPGDLHLHVVHGMLAPSRIKLMGDDVTWVEDLNPECDAVFAGHFHGGWDPVLQNGVWFFNPGSLGRVDASTDSVKRIPKIAVMEVLRGKFMVSYTPISCAPKGEDVFDRTQIEEAKRQQAALEKFMDGLSGSSIVEDTDIYQLLRKMADEEKLPMRLLDLAHKRLTEAEEAVREEDEDEAESA